MAPARTGATLVGRRTSSILVRIGQRGTLTLPKELRSALDDQRGFVFEVVRRDDGVIELRPQCADGSHAERDPSQAWFWTDRWQRMEREANADIEAGRVQHFDNAGDLLAHLDSIAPAERPPSEP